MAASLLSGGLQGFLLVSFLLFILGLATVLLRRSLIFQFMGLELMLNACNLALLAFGHWRGNNLEASVFYLFIIAIAACEAAVGLALLIAMFRHRKTTDGDCVGGLKQ